MNGRVLLTGATGYVGGRLLPLLENTGRPVRCLVRHAGSLAGRTQPATEVVEGDVLRRESLDSALREVETAFYLVHSMGASSGDFEERDRVAARNFSESARAAGVKRIVYLGGLGEDHPGLSSHLRSRHEVGALLRESGVDVIEFRASIVIGSGSLSFEMIRALVERLPVMITPRWVSVPAQPIAIEDVLQFLLGALTVELPGGKIVEIGGPEVLSYGDLMREYARQRGLRRWLIAVPVLTPRLSSLWLGLVTPVYARVGRKLVDSIRHPTLVRDPSAQRLFPVRPMGAREAIARALRNEDREFAATRWSDALSAGGELPHWGGVRFGNRLVDSRTVTVQVPVSRAFRVVQRIGGATGWYYATWLWKVRGYLDLLVGGVGLRRGRRHPGALQVGDVVDCWRVEAIEPDHRLMLRAEMRLPGRAWLEFKVEPTATGACIRQTAMFDPVGLWGLAYWYSVWPLHEVVFRGMLHRIAREAEA